MPKVSVIITCYNLGSYLDEAVASVLAQTFSDFEIIVVDDGSSEDETRQVLDKLDHPKIRLIRIKNSGLPTARNTGIGEANGALILPLDADDKIGSTFMEEAVKILDKKPEVGIVYGGVEYFGARSGVWEFPDYSFSYILQNNCLHACSFFRKSDWERVGGYKTNMEFGWEDWDFWLSLIEIGREVAKVPGVQIYYRVRHDSMARSMDAYVQFLMRLQIIQNHRDLFRDFTSLDFSLKFAQLFYDDGPGFSEDRSFVATIGSGLNSFEFDLSQLPDVKRLRFDPANCPVEILLHSIRVWSEDGESSIDGFEHNAHMPKENCYLYPTSDPQIIFPVSGNVVKVAFEIEYLSSGSAVFGRLIENKETIIKNMQAELKKIAAESKSRDKREEELNRTLLKQKSELDDLHSGRQKMVEKNQDLTDELKENLEKIKRSHRINSDLRQRNSVLQESFESINRSFITRLAKLFRKTNFPTKKNPVSLVLKSINDRAFGPETDELNAGPLVGHLQLNGWLQSRQPVVSVDLSINGQKIVSEQILEIEKRDDFSDSRSSLSYNFLLKVPISKIGYGSRQLRLAVRDNRGKWFAEPEWEYGIYLPAPAPEETLFAIDSIGSAVFDPAALPLYVNYSDGGLKITGWAVDSSSGEAAREVYLKIDGLLYRVHYGLFRKDVADSYRNPAYTYCGFEIFLIRSQVKPGTHSVSLKILSADSGCVYSSAEYLVDLHDDSYKLWIKQTEPSKKELEKQRLNRFSREPVISLITPVYETAEGELRQMIDSVLQQTYAKWELCLCDDGSRQSNSKEILTEAAQKDSRIRVHFSKTNRGIAASSNEAVAMASGDYVALLDHDDVLAPDALFEMVTSLNENPEADFFYSDEDRFVSSPEKDRFNPLFKPDWSPDLLRAQNYICHLTMLEKKLVEKVGGFRSGFEGAQDYDLFLLATEQARKVIHIPKILYHWRQSTGSFSGNENTWKQAGEAGKRTVQEHLDRVFGKDLARVQQDQNLWNVYDIRYPTRETAPLVSIIIPSRDNLDLLKKCVDSILELTEYSNYEIIILDNRSREKESLAWLKIISSENNNLRVIAADYPFNWSKVNNHGIRESRGDVFIFLNNDTQVISPDWLERFCEKAQRRDVGVVGPQLLYPDLTIQHAGVVVGMGGWAGHVYNGLPACHDSTPYISPQVTRNVLAVTGACLVVSRRTVEQLGAFNEEFEICGSDVELGIRCFKAGLNNIYDPYIQLYHHESKTRTAYIPANDFSCSERYYRPYRDSGDPFYNKNLSTDVEIPTLELESRAPRELSAGSGGHIFEITPIHIRKSKHSGRRLNLLVPSINREYVFGGIATALKIFSRLQAELGEDYSFRIIVTDTPLGNEAENLFDRFEVVSPEDDPENRCQILGLHHRSGITIPVWEQDIFLATAWWTAYVIKRVIREQADLYQKALKKMLYLIQDYEPEFYGWSSQYLLTGSTYSQDIPTIALFNTSLLRDYFNRQGLKFDTSYAFEAKMNEFLFYYLKNHRIEKFRKEKIILVYGRPTVTRNCFPLVVAGLRGLVSLKPDISEWRIYSAGEPHTDIELGAGIKLESLGKLDLSDYAELLARAAVGMSLMVSPHPSYPPLEMAHFGMLTVTNSYANKDLSSWHDNIVSIDENISQLDVVSQRLLECCERFEQDKRVGLKAGSHVPAYLDESEPFPFIKELVSELKEKT